MNNSNRKGCSYSEKPNNSDSIYRQDALEALRTCYETERIDYTNGNEYINYEQAVHEVEELSSAQPEVIRCKDCKWKQGSECVRFADVRPFPDDFCSRAERRTDE